MKKNKYPIFDDFEIEINKKKAIFHFDGGDLRERKNIDNNEEIATAVQKIHNFIVEHNLANNGKKFYDTYINKESILNYLEIIINKLALNFNTNSVKEDVFEVIMEDDDLTVNYEFPTKNIANLIGRNRKNLTYLETLGDCKITYSHKFLADKHSEWYDDDVSIYVHTVTIDGKKTGVELVKKKIVNIANRKTVEFELTANEIGGRGKKTTLGALIGRKGSRLKAIISW